MKNEERTGFSAFKKNASKIDVDVRDG